jgi:diphosphomevalonate decarboxylase
MTRAWASDFNSIAEPLTMDCSHTATARAHPNIALVKYWGKRDLALNLPAAGSISVTLDTLKTETTVVFDPRLDSDTLELNGKPDPARLPRVTDCLDRLRQMADCQTRAHISSINNFPTAAGLASSASGFAALVEAAAAALHLDLPESERSILARQGSGSAARSVFSGFVEMQAGERADGTDCHAHCLATPDHWPLSVVVAITSDQVKGESSSEGMEHSRASSPFFDAWVKDINSDLPLARQAIAQRDFAALAVVSEHSCLKMHAVMLSSNPGLIYWNGATVDCLKAIRGLRDTGKAVFFTVDAGPQVKAVCLPRDAAEVASTLGEIPGVERTLTTGLGNGSSTLEVG